MVSDHLETVKRFQTNAEKVSATVQTFFTAQEAIEAAIDICSKKKTCTLLPSGCEAHLSDAAEALCDTKFSKHMIAAPDLDAGLGRWLKECCLKTGMKIITDGLRSQMGGIDMGITWAQYGIAQTGTLVINSTNEDLRLATMISEIHVALLEKKNIHESADDLILPLKKWMADADNYTAFITGASRTADIERVLALGVHGPLELYIMLIEGDK